MAPLHHDGCSDHPSGPGDEYSGRLDSCRHRLRRRRRSHVVWQEGADYAGDVHLCRLDASGQVVMSDLVVSTAAGYPRVSALPTGESDVVWQQFLTADRDVHYRRMTLSA